MLATTRMWIEIVSTAFYLIAMWTIVVLMARKQRFLSPEKQHLGLFSLGAFTALTLGDSGHIVFRSMAYLSGNPGIQITLFDKQVRLVGLGMLSTSITLTVFYAMMVMVWHERYKNPYGWFEYLLFGAAIVRLILLTLPQNGWSGPQSPQDWTIYRNIPFVIQGLGVAYLILRNAIGDQDRLFQWIGGMIVLSYVFYIPVILWSHTIPLIGMLMLPKSIIYASIAGLVYTGLFSTSSTKSQTME
jgi:hypothetical protein